MAFRKVFKGIVALSKGIFLLGVLLVSFYFALAVVAL